jgi:flagella basal body P-ring formation protein FlgA
MTLRSAIAFVALATGAATAQAQSFENLEGIERQVAAFAEGDPANPASTLIPVDRRLRLSACAAALELAWPGTRRDSVLVRCPQPGGWKIYVRLLASSTARAAATPVVMRGDSVTVTLRGPGFSVSQSGEAMDAGAVNSWVRVRVGKDGEMRARVLRPGVVGMNLP